MKKIVVDRPFVEKARSLIERGFEALSKFPAVLPNEVHSSQVAIFADPWSDVTQGLLALAREMWLGGMRGLAGDIEVAFSDKSGQYGSNPNDPALIVAAFARDDQGQILFRLDPSTGQSQPMFDAEKLKRWYAVNLAWLKSAKKQIAKVERMLNQAA
jgi:hypothetical protein